MRGNVSKNNGANERKPLTRRQHIKITKRLEEVPISAQAILHKLARDPFYIYKLADI